MSVSDLTSRPGVDVEYGDLLSEQATLFRGTFWHRELRRGLFVHASNVVEDTGFTALSSHNAGLSCVFFLQGDVEVGIGDRKFRFRETGQARLREALVIPSVQTERFRRRSLGRQRVRHLVISATPEWLDRDGLGSAANPGAAKTLAGDHLASRQWRVGQRLLELVEQVLAADSSSNIGHLYAESAAVAILAEALAADGGQVAAGTVQVGSARERARLARARDLIMASGGDFPTVDAIAQEAGVSPSSLQRLFKANYAMSVFEYIRTARLEQARELIASGASSIQEAASVAGYSSPANFSTAFRRQFGMTPKQASRRWA